MHGSGALSIWIDSCSESFSRIVEPDFTAQEIDPLKTRDDFCGIWVRGRVSGLPWAGDPVDSSQMRMSTRPELASESLEKDYFHMHIQELGGVLFGIIHSMGGVLAGIGHFMHTLDTGVFGVNPHDTGVFGANK